MRPNAERHDARPQPARASLYQEVTDRTIADMEKGTVPWVQPWGQAKVRLELPVNAVTNRRYSGVNILILWRAAVDRGFARQQWLTFRQALAAGGSVRKGERGTTVCYADRFIPKEELARAAQTGDKPEGVAFLKRFTVFNVAQCDGLPEDLVSAPQAVSEDNVIPRAEALIAATGADFRIGGDRAVYMPLTDYIQVPAQASFHKAINYYRTCLHELGHWTGHPTRLARDMTVRFGSPGYAREELVAEMTAAFTCAALEIVPTVRHADYLSSWLRVLREDSRAIFKAASAASKAADYLLGFDIQVGELR